MIKKGKRVLFVSYDGLSDPLGQSQILPYYMGLSAKGHQITILSCEKEAAFELKKNEIQLKTKAAGIVWLHRFYRKSPPVISTFLDLLEMKKMALEAHSEQAFDLVHCRTILTCDIGLALQKRGAKFIFDFRGFWADERVDGKLWPQNQVLYRKLYQRFKKKEKKAFQKADQLVSLTESAKSHLIHEFEISGDKIAVVPCTADLEHFNSKKINQESLELLRKQLGLNDAHPVIAYLGSLGTRYMYREMLDCFQVILSKYPKAKFLIVSNSEADSLKQYAESIGIGDSICLTSTSYAEIPKYIALANIALYFIYAGNSGQAVSPTKQAEFLGLGLPIVSNLGIGDTASILKKESGGLFVEAFNQQEYEKIRDGLEDLLAISPSHLEAIAKKYFDLSSGIATYHSVYQKL